MTATEYLINLDRILAAVGPLIHAQGQRDALNKAADGLVTADVWTPEEAILWLRERAERVGE